MLSKQVKERQRANRVRRKLCANKKNRACIQFAVRRGCHVQLLSSKHIEEAQAKLDAWTDFSGLIINGAVILEDADLVAEKTWGLGLQQRLIDSEQRRRSNFSSLLD